MKVIKTIRSSHLSDWILAFIVCGSVAYLFYKSMIAIVVLSLASVYVVKLLNESRVKKEKWQLTLQFKDGIQSLSNALGAGYSIENAFGEAVRDLRFLYEEDAEIVKEFQTINQQIKLNRNIEELLMEFGNHSGVEDIMSFAEVVTTAKRTGGDLIKIIKTTSDSISDKIEVQREISTLIAAKKLEGNIMCVIPFGIIIYLNVCMPDFLTPMYDSVVGRLVMTVALAVYIVAVVILNKIVDIKV